jgi:hypothetical protein
MLRSKKFSALFLVIAVMASILATALPAWAAPLATATRTSDAAIFPGTGQTATIRVNNTAANPITGEAINAVRIILPTGTTGVGNNTAVAATAPTGWTVQRVSSGNLQTLLYKTTGSGIGFGGNQTFNVPINVAKPANSDRTGAYQVQVSSDGGATSTGVAAVGSTLGQTVRVLQVTAVAATGPDSRVTDGNATAGQAITMGVTFKNYAANAITIDPSLTSNNNSDTITDDGSTLSVPAGTATGDGTATKSFPVTLGGASGSDRTAQFTGDGAATNIDGVSLQSNYVVQVPPTLGLTASSFTPKNVRPHETIQYTFEIASTKSGTPGLDVTAGELRVANLDPDLQVPVNYAGSGSTATLKFGPTLVGFDNADGTHNGEFTFSGMDANGMAFSQTVSIANLLNIDRIVPTVTVAASLPNDSEGDAQTAASDGNTISVDGTVDDTSATIDFVEIRDNAGGIFSVPVTRTGNNFSGELDVDFTEGASSFLAAAQATDPAGNSGGEESSALEVDNADPEMIEAMLLSTTKLQVQFDDGLASNGNARLVKGGCNASQWTVQGNIVTAVSYSDSTPCADSQAGPDNYRILTLAQPVDAEEPGEVTYTPRAIFRDQAKDGADNFTATTLLEWVSAIAPDAPTIQAVERNGGTETAVFDDDKYWTRFGGEDLTVDFAGARAGYFVIVKDGNGAVLREQPVSGTTGTVTIPLGTTEGIYARSLQLRGTNNMLSDLTNFNVALDTTSPLIASAVKEASGAVTVKFTEILWSGSNFSFDWYGYELDGAGERIYYGADKVSGTGDTRTVEVAWANQGTFGGVDYIAQEGGDRYEDRAGNTFGNTTVFDGS